MLIRQCIPYESINRIKKDKFFLIYVVILKVPNLL